MSFASLRMIGNEDHKQQCVRFACLPPAKETLRNSILVGSGHHGDEDSVRRTCARERTRAISDTLTMICNVLFRKVT